MSPIRAFVRTHRAAAALLIAAALMLRILVPTGFMPSLENGRMVVAVCNGMGEATMVIDVPRLEHKRDAGAQGSCAFADLSTPSLAGADSIQLAALIAFVLALGTAIAVLLAPVAPIRLRPPLRGPPAHA